MFPASRALPRPNIVGEDNTVTSACSAMPYRDDLFGPQFANSIFISEPSENLIHREVLTESGASFASHRPSEEQSSEFLASTDAGAETALPSARAPLGVISPLTRER